MPYPSFVALCLLLSLTTTVGAVPAAGSEAAEDPSPPFDSKASAVEAAEPWVSRFTESELEPVKSEANRIVTAAFDDLSVNTFLVVPLKYSATNITWNNFYAGNSTYYATASPNYNYLSATISPPNLAFNGFGTPASFTSTTSVCYSFSAYFSTGYKGANSSLVITSIPAGAFSYKVALPVNVPLFFKTNVGCATSVSITLETAGSSGFLFMDNFIFYFEDSPPPPPPPPPPVPAVIVSADFDDLPAGPLAIPYNYRPNSTFTWSGFYAVAAKQNGGNYLLGLISPPNVAYFQTGVLFSSNGQPTCLSLSAYFTSSYASSSNSLTVYAGNFTQTVNLPSNSPVFFRLPYMCVTSIKFAGSSYNVVVDNVKFELSGPTPTPGKICGTTDGLVFALGGATAKDSSKSALALTPAGTGVKCGSSFSGVNGVCAFDGLPTSYFTLESRVNSIFPSGSSARTVCVWRGFANSQASSGVYLSYGGGQMSGSGSRFISMRYNYREIISHNSYDTSGPLSTVQWSHWCVVVADSVATWYNNGVANGTYTTTEKTANTDAAFVGAFTASLSIYNMNGGLYDLRLYNRALAPSEIAGIYGATTDNKCPY